MVNHLLATSHPLSSSAPRPCVSVFAPSSILRTLFQVPYPATPLFPTLTKTAGVWGYSSHFGPSRPKPREVHPAAPAKTPPAPTLSGTWSGRPIPASFFKDHGPLSTDHCSYQLRLGNTCTLGQIDGIAGAVEDWGYERSHCSLTPAKLASLSQDACASAGARAQRKEVPRDLRNPGGQRVRRPFAAEARN